MMGMARVARGAAGTSCWSRYSSTARRSWRATGTPVRSRMRASRRASTVGTSQRYMWGHLPSLLVTTPSRPYQIDKRSEPRNHRRADTGLCYDFWHAYALPDLRFSARGTARGEEAWGDGRTLPGLQAHLPLVQHRPEQLRDPADVHSRQLAGWTLEAFVSGPPRAID